jgi:hypothetical protein
MRTKVWSEQLKGRKHWGDLRADERKILKRILIINEMCDCGLDLYGPA